MVAALPCAGHCPIDPLAMPRRLTDGSLANALNYHANAPALPSLSTVSTIAVSAGIADPYAAASVVNAGLLPEGWRQKSPMRKRIVNLSAKPGGSGSSSDLSLSPVGAAAVGLAASRGGSPGSPGSGSSSKAVGAPRSPDIFATMQSLQQANPALPIGANSVLRRSAANNGPKS
jgi:hypothetical protein